MVRVVRKQWRNASLSKPRHLQNIIPRHPKRNCCGSSCSHGRKPVGVTSLGVSACCPIHSVVTMVLNLLIAHGLTLSCPSLCSLFFSSSRSYFLLLPLLPSSFFPSSSFLHLSYHPTLSYQLDYLFNTLSSTAISTPFTAYYFFFFYTTLS